jgi:3-dehydroquinate dehydratase-1
MVRGASVKPTVTTPIAIRGVQYGGPQPLFCIPVVAADRLHLVDEAQVAASLKPDLVEWRADFYRQATPSDLVNAANTLREIVGNIPIVFTQRVRSEGGAQAQPQSLRSQLIEAVLCSSTVDIVDLELANETEFLERLTAVARAAGVRVLLAMHNFEETPSNESLFETVRIMRAYGADIAKCAVMPKSDDDVLRLLQVTTLVRRAFPEMPLAMMSMGALGSITRVAGFLYGSDMAFAVGKTASAPGQIPIDDARRATDLLLRYS